MEKILKATTKGQITLPSSWRNKFSTNYFSVIQKEGDVLEIKPLNLKDSEEEKEYTVFDAIRDNQGKGIKASDLINILKGID